MEYGKEIILDSRAIDYIRRWLEALDMAVNRRFSDGVRDKEIFLMSDNGSQPTSAGFMKTYRGLNIQQAFTS